MFGASKTASVSTGGYQISRSLRFSQPDSTFLARTPTSAGSRTTWTLSGWFKGFKSNLNNVIYVAGSGANQTGIYIDSANQQLNFYEIQSSSTIGNLVTTQVFRDISAWYHIVAVYDSTQATASSRMRLYVNGTQVTAFGTATYVSQNTNSIANSAVITEFGNGSGNAAFYDGLMTELNFIDGQALTPSSFGATDAQTGVWSPIAYSGSYGTNGFYLNFSDNSNTTAATLGKDYSGNGNNWTPNNFSVTAGAGNDSLVDSPTSYGTDTGVGGTVRGNYATLNPLQLDSVTTLANGNLDYSRTILGGSPGGAFSTIGMTSGKWYAEFTLNTSNFLFGVWGNGTASLPQTGYGSYYWDFGQQTGTLSLEKSSGTSSGSGGTVVAGNVYAVAVDIDSGTISFYQNNTLAYSVTGMSFTGPLFFVSCVWTNSVSTGPNSLNFGQRPFAYTAPSGFKALCTQNLPTPTIGATSATLATQYFTPVLYTGNGYPTAGTQSITTVGFQPDFIWIKNRSSAASHTLTDAVRGVNSQLFSNQTAAQEANTDDVTAFTSTGFNLGSGTTGVYPNVNTNSATYVAWNWKANGSGSSNTAGSITSTVSANTTSGFSIVTWTGTGVAATVGHGLGVAPSMIFVKQRTNQAGYNWFVYNQTIGNTQWLILNDTRAASSATNAWNNTSPTSTVFSVSGYDEVNRSTSTFVAYCFAQIAGYSAFGSYTGNGTAGDGPFVYTGFRPVFVMIKASSTTGDWLILDNSRSPYNVEQARLKPNSSAAEVSGDGYDYIDALSNGFKLRGIAGSNGTNGSGNTYIYACFAQNPFKYSLAR